MKWNIALLRCKYHCQIIPKNPTFYDSYFMINITRIKLVILSSSEISHSYKLWTGEILILCMFSVLPKIFKEMDVHEMAQGETTGSLVTWVWYPGHTLWKKSSCKSASNFHIYVKVTPLWMCMCVCMCVCKMEKQT